MYVACVLCCVLSRVLCHVSLSLLARVPRCPKDDEVQEFRKLVTIHHASRGGMLRQDTHHR